VRPRPTRWLLQPHETAHVELHFASARLGQFRQSLSFEVVGFAGVIAPVSLTGAAVCAMPAISSEPRNVFHRKIKSKAPIAVRRQWVSSRAAFEWGPLLVGVDGDVKKGEYAAANTEVFHISNTSLFDAEVFFSFLQHGVGRFTPPAEEGADDDGAAGAAAGRPKTPGKEARPGSGAFGAGSGSAIFKVEPQSLLLRKDETAGEPPPHARARLPPPTHHHYHHHPPSLLV
jgi:hypothetical protein